MAGTAAWSSARKDIRTALDRAQSFHDEAAIGWEDVTGKLASSSKTALDLGYKIEATYGDAIGNLQAFKDSTTFAAQYRDQVPLFEDLVFVNLVLPETMEPKVAAAVATKDGVLSTLGTLRAMETRSNPAAVAFVRAFSWIRQAWDDAVQRTGLSLRDYAAVRAFKGVSNASFHAAVEPQQALLVLQSSVPVPEDMQAYKEPLIALLRILASA